MRDDSGMSAGVGAGAPVRTVRELRLAARGGAAGNLGGKGGGALHPSTLTDRPQSARRPLTARQDVPPPIMVVDSSQHLRHNHLQMVSPVGAPRRRPVSAGGAAALRRSSFGVGGGVSFAGLRTPTPTKQRSHPGPHLAHQHPPHHQADEDVQGQKRGRNRYRRRVEETYGYLSERVDPLLRDCLTHMLSTRPDNIVDAMLGYFRGTGNGEQAEAAAKAAVATGTNNLSAEPSEVLPATPRTMRRTKARDRVFMAKHISPVLTRLMNRIVVERPSDVFGFIVAELQRMQEADREPAKPPAAESEEPVRPPTAPSAPSAPRSYQILMLGLDGAGKSSMLAAAQGDKNAKVPKTMGFRPLSMQLSETIKIQFYDLGGGQKIRSIWGNYYHDVHGIVYVVDSADASRLEESVNEFRGAIQHSFLNGKPLLILANKQDLPNALSVTEIANAFGYSSGTGDSNNDNDSDIITVDGHRTRLAPCYCIPSTDSGDFDTRLDTHLSWLFDSIDALYHDLSKRVDDDTRAKNEEVARERAARDRRVLKDQIVKAHPEIGGEKEDCFSEQDGIEFLAAEMGVEEAGLCDEALEVAHMVGYQKLALQMVGGMNCPYSKKKTPVPWPEIRQLVVDLRTELGLSASA